MEVSVLLSTSERLTPISISVPPMLVLFAVSERGGSAVKTFMRVSVIAVNREGSGGVERSESEQGL
jgi:hypothetical protein